jgi:hypothetical protein
MSGDRGFRKEELDMTSFDNYLSNQLKNSEFKKEYDKLKPEYDSIQKSIDLQKSSKVKEYTNEKL